MIAFGTPVDIANRALQHCSRPRIFSFADTNPAAAEIKFNYDKLRRAELRRNVWRFATRRAILRPLDVSTYMLSPAAWSATNIYMAGSVVAFGGQLYFSLTNNNLGVQPDLDPTSWTLYFGPMTVNLWQDPGQVENLSYWAGELVYTPAGEGYTVYMSLTSGNTDTPGTFPNWSATAVYNTGDTVMVSRQMVSDPGSLPVFSDPGFLPVMFQASYQSTQDLNVGNDPTATTGSWVTLPVPSQPDERNGQNWMQLDARVRAIITPYPLTAGPVTQLKSRNAFWLPNGFLREAPQDPKAGAGVYLGALSALPLTDWTWEGNFIVSTSINPIMLRFVADIADVTLMDDMFCEGLACRIAKESAPMLVTGPDHLMRMQGIERVYQQIMGEARLVNSIETGFVDPPMDDYIQCRF